MRTIFAVILALVLPVSLQASVVILNGLSHTHSIANVGERAQGSIRVKNEGGKEARIVIYRQDLLLECGQAAQYLDPGALPGSLGNGVQTNVDERVLAPGEEYDVRYTIEVDKAKTPGTYWEVVMVEVADPVREQPRNGVQVNSRIRYAIQLIANVGSAEAAQLSYEDVVYDKVSEKLSVLKVTLKNNSGFGARTNVVLEIYDAEGKKLKTTEPNTRMLYPGNCSTFEIPVSDIPKGKYECVIVADTKKDLFGSNISLNIE